MSISKFIPIIRPGRLNRLKVQKRLVVADNYSLSKSNLDLSVGLFGLKVLSSFQITPNQLETCRRILKKSFSKKKKGFFKINLFPSFPITKKSSGIRMGKGKGVIDNWIFPVKKGRIIFEFSGLRKFKVFYILKQLSTKLPIKLKLIEQ